MLSLCALSPSLVGAATLSVDEAKDVAAEFFQSSDVHRLADRDAFVLAHTATDGASTPICYVFNAKDGKGFVIVSADDGSLPVIGYSDNSTWSVASVPASAKRVLLEPVKVSSDTRRRVLAHASAKSESKLLQTPSWSQEAPFNNMIPNRRLTGCVGVALAEILKYHNYPASRPASLVNAGEDAQYSWSVMRNDNYRSGYSEEEAKAVASLVADAAIGIGTDFGLSSSSAYEVKVPYALTSLFGYDAGVSYKKRQEMTRDAWDQLIVDEIDADRPVLYCGQDVSAGHAFVCDGYEMRGGSTPYFHINWGWGGSANGYYATDALNPVVSKAHKYNDLMTIVYNIKPAADNKVWSDIHVTSDECQPGLTLNVSDISSVDSFTVRVGALKNISNTDFSGKIAVALFDASGNQKGLLSDPRNLSIWALQISKYVDFSCKLPAGVSVADSDKVGIVTMANGSSEWLPLAGDRLAPAEVSAKNYEVPYLTVTLPNSDNFFTISAPESKAILGRDFVFTLVQHDPSRLITLKANGFILSPEADGITYRLSNVMESQRVTVNIQIAANVLSKSTLWVTAGNLQNLLSDDECASIKDLTLYGTINASDFNFMRDRMKLQRLDISETTIVAQGSNPANAIPTKAFMGYRSLTQVVLPKNLTTFKNACFGQTGLTSVDIPAGVATWEYNVFANCTALRQVTVRRSAPVWINWCVFTNTPQAKLIVPSGAAAAYKSKEYWQDFKEISEDLPYESDEFTVKVAEKAGIKFTKITNEDYFYKGETYEFKVETDNSFQDAVMQVYANSTLLTPDASGVYKHAITANTLIHVEFRQPQSTTVDQTWKLTGEAGGIGLATNVVNVPFNQSFVVRANAIKVPKGDDAAKFYGMVLTDKNGAIKEFISSILSNYYSRTGENLTYNFYCQVKEAEIKDGNQIRLATSYNKKDWQLVEGESAEITDRILAVNNPVVYHSVTMPQSVTGARIEGGATEVVRGMPFSVKVSAVNPAQRVTVSVNGETKATNVAVANVSIPAVLDDLDITITVKDADAGDYMVFNIQEGQLASKLVDCPARVKLMGTMLVSDFDALRANAAVIIDLDMADVTIKGAAMTGNSIPENAFAPTSAGSLSALKTIILPNNLERINKNAFARCTQISEITIPANVSYIGDGAFSACVGLKKIIAKPKVAPTCGNMSPFPTNPSAISLEVPKGSEESYSVPSIWWAKLSLYKAPTEQKDYYWVKVDQSRVGVIDYRGDLNSIGVGSADMEFILELPNCQYSGLKQEYRTYQRPGVPFKLYDNGVDVFANLGSYQYQKYTYVYPNQHWSMNGGRLGIRYLHSSTSGPWMPQNHTIDIYFYYSIKFENKEGAEGVQAQVVEVPEGCEWRNVAMNNFQYTNGNMMNTEVKPVLYREGSEIKFQLTDVAPKTQLSVSMVSKVMTQSGPSPVYEEREMELESNNGIYTIPSLDGDTWIRITGTETFEEGDPIPAEALSSINVEDVVGYSELTVTGEMNDEDFESIRDTFVSLESLDLTGIDNTSIPEGAFEGMNQLKDVIVPESITEIGAGAFAGCENIESLTLPGVTSIGEGAFEGCDNLTSILLPSLGSDASGKPGMRKSGNVDGVTADSFKGLNPNCLIYVGSADIPDSEALNIILNVGGTRVAASDINLDGNHSFNAPASFMLGDHKISFTAEIVASDSCDVDGGWKTIILPFQPTEMKVGAEFGDRNGSGIHIISFDDEDSEVLTEQTTLLPNRPYLANVCAPFTSVPVTFTASGRVQDGESVVFDVPFTPVPEDLVAVGKDFSLYGSYDGQTRPVVCYALNEDASKFVRPAADESVTVPSFSAYLVANVGTDKAEMAIGKHPIWVHEPASVGVAGTKLYRSNLIDIASATKKASIYYTVDGSDPKESSERILYTGPFAMDSDVMNIKAVAEYADYVSDVVSLDYELRKANINYDLAQNWNWISQNTESPVAVADFATEGVNSILSQTQEVVRDPKHGLVGNLTELAPAVGYKVYVDGDGWNGNVSGIAFDPIATIKLNKGWNWIGTPVDEGSLLIEDLLAGLKVEEGDMIVGLDGFAQADAEGAWIGTVSKMNPGVGYMYFSNSDKEFVYNLIAAHDAEVAQKAPVAAANGNWYVDNHKYASVMPLVARLIMDNGFAVDADDYVVGAFCGEECRGIGVALNGTVMINIHGNSGDVISFRIIDSLDTEKVSSSTVAFNVDKISTFANPVSVNIEDVTAVDSVNADNFGIYVDGSNLLFNGDLSAVKSVEVYDVAGVKIAKAGKSNSNNIVIEGLDKGVVTVVVRTENGNFSRKMIIK